MEFNVKITIQGLGKVEDIAAWSVGAPGQMNMNANPHTSQALTQLAATTIYKIVTVQVGAYLYFLCPFLIV